MSLNYSVYFIKKPQHLEAVENQFDETLYTPENCEWLAGNYSGSPSDSVFDSKRSMIQTFSERAGAEVLFIYVDGMTEMFRYEHAKDGVLLRKLLLLNDGSTAVWCAAEGTPEPWEDEVIFSPAALERALKSPFLDYDLKNGSERDVAAKERFKDELQVLYRDKSFLLGEVWPLCDVEGLALSVQKYYATELPPHRDWSRY